jgi:serine/threonine-protein kinase
MSETQRQIIPGTTRIGHYEVTDILGSGGMGTVYRGIDTRLRRVVAIKVLRPERRLDSSAERRFLREARLLSKLNHPGICQVYDLVENDGDQFLILEYVDGVSLKEEATRNLDHHRILQIILETAEALEAAHREQIIHRDLKPENIMLTPDGHTKILDFGIARLADPSIDQSSPNQPSIDIEMTVEEETSTSSQTQDWTVVDSYPDDLGGERSCTLLTRRGTIVGTPAFMAPEQVLGDVPTTACDIYSVGIILHQLLTGSSPYGEGLTTMELLIRVSEARTLPIEGLDTDVITLITDLTAQSPEDRPSAAECASRIRSILAKPEQLRRRRIIVALSVVAGAALLVAAGVTMSQQWRVRRQARLAREFAEKASSVEWLMRAEHLAPPHDLTNARRQVRTTIAELEARVSGIDDQNAAPGHAAIGRAWASLGDDRKATDSLEMAWRLGMRTPQLSCALGRSLGALYDQALRETYRVSDPQLRQEAVEEAQGKYREPALNHLKRCRGDPNLPQGLVDAMIAMFEGRLDDCNTLLDGIGDVPAWNYDVDAMRFRYLATRASVEARTNLDLEVSFLQEALEPLGRAIEIGRSDPVLQDLYCDTEVEILNNKIFAQHQQGSDEEFERALKICRAVSAIDPAIPGGPTRIVEIFSLRGQAAFHAGKDPEDDFRQAHKMADTLIVSFPESHSAYWVRAKLNLFEAQSKVWSGQDATTSIHQCIADNRMVKELYPTSLEQVGNDIGNCAFIGAVQDYWSGKDPSRWVSTGIDALHPLLDDPDHLVYPHTNAANLAFLQALWEHGHGIDPTSSIDKAITSYRIVTESNPSGINIANLANALTEKATDRMRAGHNPGETFDQAEAEIRRAIETGPALDLPYFLMGNLMSGRAELVLQRAGNPQSFLRKAFENYAKGLEINPGNMEGYTEAADSRITEARRLITQGKNPVPTLKRCRDLAGETLKLNPSFSRARRVIVESHLIQGLWLASREQSPLEMLDSAQEATLELLETAQGEADNHRLLAEIHLARARWFRAHDNQISVDVEDGLAAAKRSLEINDRSMAARHILTELEALQ